jgi:hypothetical protein
MNRKGGDIIRITSRMPPRQLVTIMAIGIPFGAFTNPNQFRKYLPTDPERRLASELPKIARLLIDTISVDRHWPNVEAATYAAAKMK